MQRKAERAARPAYLRTDYYPTHLHEKFTYDVWI